MEKQSVKSRAGIKYAVSTEEACTHPPLPCMLQPGLEQNEGLWRQATVQPGEFRGLPEFCASAVNQAATHVCVHRTSTGKHGVGAVSTEVHQPSEEDIEEAGSSSRANTPRCLD